MVTPENLEDEAMVAALSRPIGGVQFRKARGELIARLRLLRVERDEARAELAQLVESLKAAIAKQEGRS